jgi:6-phosphogluconolactonase/glucosamine-6-phosphate isomerase/deaminase
MTVTPFVIESAREVLVLVAGDAKAAMVARALEGPTDIHAIPVQLAKARSWILDRAAAHQLQESH